MQDMAIVSYISDLLHDLDGYGIVLVDEDLVRERLKEYGLFTELKNICKEG